MKWFGIGLLVINIALFAWFVTAPGAKPNAAPITTEQIPRLALLSELPPSQKPPARVAIGVAELPQGADTAAPQNVDEVPLQQLAPSTTLCFRVSGFTDEVEALKFKSAAEKAGANVKAPQAENLSRTRYWVLLPPAASHAQAMAVVERLRRVGIKDYYLIPNGENRNALSLGVFSSREAASQRIAEVAGLKLKVRVEEVKSPGKQYVTEVRWPGAQPPAWNSLLSPGIESVPTACAVTP